MLVGSALIIAMKWRGREILRWLSGKDDVCQCRRHRKCQLIPELGRSCRRKWQATPVFLPGKAPAQRSLGVYTPWTHKESYTTEQLRTGRKDGIFWLVKLRSPAFCGGKGMNSALHSQKYWESEREATSERKGELLFPVKGYRCSSGQHIRCPLVLP